MADEEQSYRPETWDEFVAERPYFPDLMWKWIRLSQNLLSASPTPEGDDLGFLICGFMMASLTDLNDILTLAHSKSRSGSAKILRSIYERTVTMKYLAAHPLEVPKFIGYQSIDWEQVVKECEAMSGARMSDQSRSNLSSAAKEARRKYRNEVCSECGKRKQTDWTPKSVKERADLTGLAHMHFFGYIYPSKIMHTTFYGTMEFMKPGPPIFNILNTAHELMVHNILIHRRHFAKDATPTPMMRAVVMDFRGTWLFAQTSFDGMLREYEPGTFV
jgi:Family of unknown function (DUF5677)